MDAPMYSAKKVVTKRRILDFEVSIELYCALLFDAKITIQVLRFSQVHKYMLGLYLNIVQTQSGYSPKYMLGLCLDCVWKMFGQSLDYVQIMFRMFNNVQQCLTMFGNLEGVF